MAMQNTVKNLTQDQTASQAVTRERQDVTQWMTEFTAKSGKVAKALRLKSVSYLPASGDKKSTFGGILEGYIDPVSKQPCYFAGRNGEKIAGGVPVRLFGDEADQLIEKLDAPTGMDLMVGLAEGATAAVYRNDSGEVVYLAMNAAQLSQRFEWTKGARTIEPQEF